MSDPVHYRCLYSSGVKDDWQPTPYGPTQVGAAVTWAWQQLKLAGETHERDGGRVKQVVTGQPNCSGCDELPAFAPSHYGSSYCQSGAPAAGGTHSHCTCDGCF